MRRGAFAVIFRYVVSTLVAATRAVLHFIDRVVLDVFVYLDRGWPFSRELCLGLARPARLTKLACLLRESAFSDSGLWDALLLVCFDNVMRAVACLCKLSVSEFGASERVASLLQTLYTWLSKPRLVTLGSAELSALFVVVFFAVLLL